MADLLYRTFLIHFLESQSPYFDSIHYLYNLLIQVETKLSPFCIPQIRAHFLVWKLLRFDSNVTNIYPSQHYAINGPDNVSVPISQYAVIWTNDGIVFWRSAHHMPRWVHSVVYVCCYPRLWPFLSRHQCVNLHVTKAVTVLATEGDKQWDTRAFTS